VVSFNNVTFSYGSNLVFKDIDLHLFRGDRVALVGRNGAGKTTLTRLITGALAPNNGTIRVGDLITIGYYAQHLSEQLNPQCTVLEQVQTASGRPEKEVRNLLAIFNFRGDDVEKRIAVLSGGEKARVMLTAILARPANFIIMDEPTNHLDVTSREALEQALSGYQGTLLLISHDRSFLDKLVRRIIAVEDGGLRIFEGNYTEYHERISIDEAAQADPYGEKTAGGSRDRERKRWEAQIRQEVSGKRRNLQKTIENIENKIAIAEARKEELMSIMAQPDTYGNSSYAADLNREYRNLETDLQQLYKNWEQKSAALDALINDMEKRISQFDSQ